MGGTLSTHCEIQLCLEAFDLTKELHAMLSKIRRATSIATFLEPLFPHRLEQAAMHKKKAEAMRLPSKA